MFTWRKPLEMPAAHLRALEEMGEEPVRALLSSGQLGYGAGADIPIGATHIVRKDVELWLAWKARNFARWTYVGVIAAVLAAIFSFLALFI